MIYVEKILLKRIKNNEHFDLMEAIIDCTDELIREFELLVPLWKQLKACFDMEAKKHKKCLPEEETCVIKQEAKHRADSFRRIRQIVATYRYSPVQAEREAERQLRQLMRLYRDAPYRSYTENSALIGNFLKELTKEKYSEAVGRLHLRPLIEYAWQDNESFKEDYRHRNVHIYDKYILKLSTLRRRTDAAFSIFAGAVGHLYSVLMLLPDRTTEAQMLDEIIRRVNGQLVNAKKVYHARMNRIQLPAPISSSIK